MTRSSVIAAACTGVLFAILPFQVTADSTYTVLSANTDLSGTTWTDANGAEMSIDPEDWTNGTITAVYATIADSGNSVFNIDLPISPDIFEIRGNGTAEIMLGEEGSLSAKHYNASANAKMKLKCPTLATGDIFFGGQGVIQIAANTQRTDGSVTIEAGATVEAYEMPCSLFNIASHVSAARLKVYGTMKVGDWTWGENGTLGKLAHNSEMVQCFNDGRIIIASSFSSPRGWQISGSGMKLEVPEGVDFEVQASGKIEGNGQVSAGGSLKLLGGGNGKIMAPIRGNFAVEVLGGNWMLVGENNYNGGTKIGSGARFLNVKATQFSQLTVEDNAEIAFNEQMHQLTLTSAFTPGNAKVKIILPDNVQYRKEPLISWPANGSVVSDANFVGIGELPEKTFLTVKRDGLYLTRNNGIAVFIR